MPKTFRMIQSPIPQHSILWTSRRADPYIVKMYAVDTNDNITSREEYTEIVDMTAPEINDFTITSPVAGQLKVDVNVTDNSGGAVFCSASLYWVFTPDIELDYDYVELDIDCA